MKEVLLVFLWINIVVISGDTYNYNGYWCNKCPSGTFVRSHCSATSQTECEACPSDSYQTDPTQLTHCNRCGHYCMRKFERVHARCNATHDIICHCDAGYWLKNPRHIYCEEHKQCRPGTGVSKLGTPFSDTKCERCGRGLFSDVLSQVEPCQRLTDCKALGMVVKIPGYARKDNQCELPPAATQTEHTAEQPNKEADKSSVISSTASQDGEKLRPGEKWVGPPPGGDTHESYYHAAPVVTVLPYMVMNNFTSPATTGSSPATTGGPGLEHESGGSQGSQIGSHGDQSWKNYILFAGVAAGSLIIVFVILFLACFLLRMKRKWPFKNKPKKHTTYDEAKDPLNIGQQMHKVFGFVAANCDNNTWQHFIGNLQGVPVTQQEINDITNRSRGAVVQQIYQCLSLWYAKNNSATVEDVITALNLSGEHNLADQVRKDNPQTRIIFR